MIPSVLTLLFLSQVGSALRNNPFDPYIPCHRVISSDLKLGGFKGQWGTEKDTDSTCAMKVRMLEQEGVHFQDGKLVDQETVMWRGA